MIELTPFLKTLLTQAGLSAFETPVREVIAAAWRPLVDELTVSRVGSLHGLRRGLRHLRRASAENPHARASCFLPTWMPSG